MLRKTLIFGALYCIIHSVFCIVDVVPGPKYPATKGEVWPKPQEESKLAHYYTFNPSSFEFKVMSHNCDILDNALERYLHVISKLYALLRKVNKGRGEKRRRKLLCDPTDVTEQSDNYRGSLVNLQVKLTKPCEQYPYMGMDEEYTLVVSNDSQLTSSSIWGILRGLETFSQLFYITDDFKEVRINFTEIKDYPKYSHRGLLLDTSRHFISMSKILKTLDAMASNKMNVFHWHIVDDQSFPYQSEIFPELSERGAYHSSLVYTKVDIEKIIRYARDRGIRVIPEFDVPGHTRSWGAAYPDILTKCYEGPNVVGLGPLNPIQNSTYKFIRDLFFEVKSLFPDKYFHIGGDEVDLSCWIQNPSIVEYMIDHNMSSVSELHALFMSLAVPLLEPQKKVIVWQEVFDNKVPLANNTLVQVWKTQPVTEMLKVLRANHSVLFSSSWYLDQRLSLGAWRELYAADPRDMLPARARAGVAGGEACMWGEMVDDHNVLTRVWPRACAVAERLWSARADDADAATRRLEEQWCRLLRRGVPAAPPSGPGYCVAH